MIPARVRVKKSQMPSRRSEENTEEEEPVPRIDHAEERDRSLDRRHDPSHVPAEELTDDLPEGHGETEGHDEPVEWLATVERTERGHFGDRADRRDEERRRDQGDPEGVRQPDHGDARVGAEHVELPVGEVHHAEEPEDHREAQGQKPERGAEHDAVQELRQQHRDEVIHYRRTASRSVTRIASPTLP